MHAMIKPWILEDGSKSFSLWVRYAASYYRQRDAMKKMAFEALFAERMRLEAAKRAESEARMRAYFRSLRQ